MTLKTKNLILDLDGTLWDTTPICVRAYNHAIEEDGRASIRVDAARLKSEFGKTNKAIGDSLFPDLDESAREELMEVCASGVNRFVEEETEDVTYHGVIEAIRRLSTTCNLYIVSNCGEGYIDVFLSKSGLTDCISDIGYVGHTETNKAANIRALMGRNGIDEALYVGDTAGDYAAATAAGVPFIHATYGYGEVPEATETIDSFAEVERYVR